MKMAPRAPKIGIIQLYVPDGCTPAEQYERAAALIRKAAVDDADIVVLPEMFLGFHQESAEDKDMFAVETYKNIQKFQLLAKVASPQALCSMSLNQDKWTTNVLVGFEHQYYSRELT